MGRLDRNDIIGRKFGKLTVKSYVKDVNYKPKYLCVCDCGTEKIVDRYSLLNGEIKSCGCSYNKPENPCEIVGKRYGKLVVLGYEGQIKVPGKDSFRSAYTCKCDCGKIVSVWRGDLIQGKRTSCGNCTRIESCGDCYRYVDEKGDSFIFDKADYDLVSSHRWNINRNGYPVTKEKGCENNMPITRMLLNANDDQIVDHINGDTRDERRANLRLASRAENQRNMKLAKNNTSGFKGVTFAKDKNRYKAQIRVHGREKHIGYFDFPEEAARAYDEAARYFYGDFACVNFPRSGEQCCRRNQEEIPEEIAV